ncbi:MAG TPA: DUF1294 domain-containing protein [Candidatus Borkfalkia faecavium]|uniref:DUF1294 domain-containing protein n=1 Tax=Candidatus Borkfalkia faecavium TaxID=2838508 RepID=A0A9D1W1H8_9FIRM|nr:DUF1294 domain-containing protein [Candidatus Borkfalkia faecavium]
MIVFIAALALMSFVTFILYGADKSKAKRGAWRISEKVLLLCSFFCGAVGGLLGMLAFRHKTKHRYFWAVNVVGIAWQAAALVAMLYFGVPFFL